MNYRFTCLIAACLALGACARPVVASPDPACRPLRSSSTAFRSHTTHTVGRWYVEAPKGPGVRDSAPQSL